MNRGTPQLKHVERRYAAATTALPGGRGQVGGERQSLWVAAVYRDGRVSAPLIESRRLGLGGAGLQYEPVISRLGGRLLQGGQHPLCQSPPPQGRIGPHPLDLADALRVVAVTAAGDRHGSV